MEALSDFSIDGVARINMTGTPPRRGTWSSYNDMSPTCVQEPAVNALYPTSTPPKPSTGPSGGLALHAVWDRCTIWGAGISADLNLDEPSDGAAGTRRPYDISGFRGITFWGMTTTPGYDNKLRFKVLMRGETPIRDGGVCDENVVGVNKCLDSWGQTFTLPLSGNWQQITVLFADAAKFKQEGWGHVFVWDPTDVISIQIQAQGTEMDQPFDFWIDDVYLIR